MDSLNFNSTLFALKTEVVYKCPSPPRGTGISISLHRFSHISGTVASDHAKNSLSLASHAGRSNWMVIDKAETMLFVSEGCGNEDFTNLTEMASFGNACYSLSTLSVKEEVKNDKYRHVIFVIYNTMTEGTMHFLQSCLHKNSINAHGASRARISFVSMDEASEYRNLPAIANWFCDLNLLILSCNLFADGWKTTRIKWDHDSN